MYEYRSENVSGNLHDVAHYMNTYGRKDGWELIAVHSSGYNSTIILKRKVEEFVTMRAELEALKAQAQAGEPRKTMFEQAVDEIMGTGGIFPTTERRVPEDVRAVMEMALEALQTSRQRIQFMINNGEWYSPEKVVDKNDLAITALRNALNAAPAKDQP